MTLNESKKMLNFHGFRELYSCAFSTNEHCLEWFKRLHKVTYPRRSIEDMFAFAYYAWSIEEGKDYPRLGKDNNSYTATFNAEVSLKLRGSGAE